MIQKNGESSDSNSSDVYLHNEIINQLQSSGTVDASKIGVQVEKGTVILLGMVNTSEEKQRAKEIAERVPGVQRLENNLQASEAGGIAATISAIGSQLSGNATGNET